MVGYYFAIIFTLSFIFIFTNGITFAASFLATCTLPSVAVAGAKWGILRGDRGQKIGVPIVALLLLGFAYWVSRGVSIHAFGYYVSGLALLLISALVGLIGVPLAWSEYGQKSN